MSRIASLCFASLMILVAGCGTPETTGTDETAWEETQSSLQGGCRVICPKCPPNRICPKIACRIVCHECQVDSDCRTFANYCTGCDCEALDRSDRDPVCDGPGVRCFADPCMNYTASCLSGTCVLVSTATF